jgi:hypothetical protein
MPAPVTTTIFLHLATASDISVRALRVLDSATGASSSNEMVMSDVYGGGRKGKVDECTTENNHDVELRPVRVNIN